ncbi:hypothetical protein [Ferruginibacter sp. SUN106]|uniref:hypothetical protein n=1 Tax=Ferruginibacter sp. SUN106 TaxID=2978348 RepID=UPI003D364079
MKPVIKNALSVVTIAVFFFMAVASSHTKHMTFTKEAGQIPPDFGTTSDTLLVISHDRAYNKYLKSNFKDNYFGAYKIINNSELAAYPVSSYRFVFDHDLNYSTKTTVNTSTGASHNSTYASSDIFYVKDRTTDKKYVTKSSAYYSKLMRAYIKALEEVRKK